MLRSALVKVGATAVCRGAGRAAAVARTGAGAGAGSTARACRAQGRCMSGLVEKLQSSMTDVPLAEAVCFKKHNLKFTRADITKYGDAVACGLLELAVPGETVASFLGEGTEKSLMQIAAAKSGLVLAEASPAIAASKEGIAKVLQQSKAAIVLVEAADVPMLKEAVAELKSFDDKLGLPFRSEAFPGLRAAVHTGWDSLPGVTNFKHILIYDPQPASPLKPPSEIPDTTPLAMPFSGSGSSPAAAKTLTHADVLKGGGKAWPTVAALVDHKYIEV